MSEPAFVAANNFWRSLYQRPAVEALCCGDPSDCDGCTLSHPEIEQFAAEQKTYFDAEGNSGTIDEALS